MRALVHTLLGLCAFFGMGAVVRAVIPVPAEFGLRAKLDYFERHADEFDAVFIGSSRVYRDIIPRVIDRELASAGIEFRSFNFGIGGMEDFEADHLLRKLLDCEGARLRWLFIEAGRWEPVQADSTELMTKREVEWHTLANGRALFEAIWALDIPEKKRAKLTREHAALCASRFVAYGRGFELYRRNFGEEKSVATTDRRLLSGEELDRDRGWQPVEGKAAGLDEAKWSAQVKVLAALESKRSGAGRASLRRLPLAAIERQVELAQARVQNVIYFNLPSLQKTTYARTLARLKVYPEYTTYALPSKFPELYELEGRVDSNHLNEVGATRLSRLIAADLLKRIRVED